MASSDLISREAAVREALDMYHALAARRDACQRAKDAGGTVMWTAAAEIAQAMVRRQALTEFSNPVGDRLKDMWSALQDIKTGR